MTAAPENVWIAGEKVFEPAYHSWSGYPGRVLTVDRVTKSGRAVIGGYQYGADGRRIGGRYADRIERFTPAHQDAIDLWELRSEAMKIGDRAKWRELDRDALEKVLPILREIFPDRKPS